MYRHAALRMCESDRSADVEAPKFSQLDVAESLVRRRGVVDAPPATVYDILVISQTLHQRVEDITSRLDIIRLFGDGIAEAHAWDTRCDDVKSGQVFPYVNVSSRQPESDLYTLRTLYRARKRIRQHIYHLRDRDEALRNAVDKQQRYRRGHS